jgi:hypothetical protein
MSDTTQGLDGYTYGFDPASPDGDYAALSIRDANGKVFTFVGGELEAILQWVADEVVGENLLLNTDPHIGQDIHNAIKAKQRYILTQHGWKQAINGGKK